MIVYGSTARLAPAKPGDKPWTIINNTRDSSFWDVICHKDQFYAINGDGDGGIGGPVSAPLPNGFRRHRQQCLYLVESGSDAVLWVVSRGGTNRRRR